MTICICECCENLELALFLRWFLEFYFLIFLMFPFEIIPRSSNYSQIVWSELGLCPLGHWSHQRRSGLTTSSALQVTQLPLPAAYWLDWQALQVRRSAFGISPTFGQSSHWPSLVIWFNGQAWQPRRSIFGTSPVFVQSWHLPLLMNWCNGQALQLRASSFGTSPFGQFSQLPLFVIWLAGHSSEKTITELV